MKDNKIHGEHAQGVLVIASGRLKKLKQCEFLSGRMCGYMLLRAWNFLFFWTGIFYVFGNGEEPRLASEVFIVSAIAFVATSFFCASRHKQIAFQFAKYPRFAIGVAALAISVGSLFTLGAPLHTLVGGTSVIVAGFLTGIGTSMLDIIWGELYARSSAASSSIEVPLAFLLGSLFMPLVLVLPVGVCIAGAALLPCFSATLLLRQLDLRALKEGAQNGVRALPFAEEPPHVASLPTNRRVLLVKIALMSLIVGVCNTLMPQVLSIENGSASYTFIMPAAAAVSLIIYLCILVFSQHLDFIFAYKPVLLFMIAGYLLLIPLGATSFELLLIVAGYTCFNILNWLLLADACRRFDIPVVLSFGVGRGALVSGSIIGMVIGQMLVSTLFNFEAPIAVGAVICVLCILLSYLFVLTEQDVMLLSSRSYGHGADLSVEEQKLLLQHRKTIEICDLLAAQYELGDRARDVLVCLAQGYKVNEIEEELFMARGTVNTHMHRMYQKLGIHKRKELLDLIKEQANRLESFH